MQITDDMVWKAAVEIDALRLAYDYGQSLPEARQQAQEALEIWHAGHEDNSQKHIRIDLEIMQARAALVAVLGDN